MTFFAQRTGHSSHSNPAKHAESWKRSASLWPFLSPKPLQNHPYTSSKTNGPGQKACFFHSTDGRKAPQQNHCNVDLDIAEVACTLQFCDWTRRIRHVPPINAGTVSEPMNLGARGQLPSLVSKLNTMQRITMDSFPPRYIIGQNFNGNHPSNSKAR